MAITLITNLAESKCTLYPIGGRTYMDWAASVSMTRGFSGGERVDEPMLPKQFKIQEGDHLSDYVGKTSFSCHLLSQRFKDCVEEIDPGANQFVPVEILNQDGTPHGEIYYMFSVCTKLDAIMNSRGGLKKVYQTLDPDQHPDLWRWEIISNGAHLLSVDKKIVEHRALWRDKRHFGVVFASDKLVAMLKDRKLDGWQGLHYWHED